MQYSFLKKEQVDALDKVFERKIFSEKDLLVEYTLLVGTGGPNDIMTLFPMAIHSYHGYGTFYAVNVNQPRKKKSYYQKSTVKQYINFLRFCGSLITVQNL
ncbi:hypothetical protein TELCIR_13609 [Teladorsagia circumcincta]|uniref:Uncharacterized protein n=1 Tax=Teladorsagia circumcincta TaxID=45464 RepID=A0A2G9U5E7_TELCI|nr:hypothetical protein TELCIR_13609 [Teladorsagia circumcincta]